MDPLTMMAITQGAQAVGGIGQVVQSLFQGREANRLTASNKRPKYHVQQPIKDALSFSQSRASQGLSDQSKQTYLQEAERGTTLGVDAILKGGGNVNNIADLYGNFETGISKVALLDEQMRSENERRMLESQYKMNDELDKQWQVNVFDPYADKAQAAATLKKQASDNRWKGINSIIGAGTNFATAGQYQQQIDQMNFRPPHSIHDESYFQPTPDSTIAKNPNMVAIEKMQKKWSGLMGGYNQEYSQPETYGE